MYVSLSVLLVCMMRKLEHIQEQNIMMGFPLYFTFLHITAEGMTMAFLAV